MANPKCILQGIIIFATMIVADARAVSFSFSSFTPNMDEMNYLGDAFTSRGAIQLTRNLINEPLNSSVGRAVYNQPVRLASTFTTHFKFLITNATDGSFGDGLAFFIAAAGARLNLTSTGGWLGLTDWATDGNSSNQIVAVEFDTFQNEWDPPSDHIGFDVNSIRSVVNKTLPGQSALRRGGKIDAWVDYHAGHLSVFLSSDGLRNETADLYYDIDLRDFLPEWVTVGFAASTGDSTEIHNLLSWEFSMSDPTPAMRNGLRGPVLAPAIAIPVLSLVGMLLAFLYGRWYSFSQVNLDIDVELDGRLAYGPRPFRYKELCLATRGFADKLGQGGFGSVYYGMLPETKLAVAVKRVAQDSEQGMKEYISEISIFSQLHHQNLVRLVGWCHEGAELLLVYEHMPNRSLDQHLYGQNLLKWALRYKIACGLAHALLYLHEECQQPVVHRDVKSSNMMLDADFNAKLGDFGLSRLMEHGVQESTSSIIGGTMGYLAPECLMTGRASAEADVFSFGAVALEIVCGRRPVFDDNDDQRITLVEWVWNLYGAGKLLEAIDERLVEDYNEEEIEVVLMVGLWCSHPDPATRPIMRQVIRYLEFVAPVPQLPFKLPMPLYFPNFSPCDTNGIDNV